jgi:hypothetical protein
MSTVGARVNAWTADLEVILERSFICSLAKVRAGQNAGPDDETPALPCYSVASNI